MAGKFSNELTKTMRYFYIFLLLSIPCLAGATMPTSVGNCEKATSSFSYSIKQQGGKSGFFQRFIEKSLLKRLKKKAKAEGLFGYSDGRWLAASGLAVGILGILSWFVNPYLGLILSIPLGLLGVLLCIVSLKKARNSYDTGVVKGVAIAGLVINGALAVGLLLAITLFSS